MKIRHVALPLVLLTASAPVTAATVTLKSLFDGDPITSGDWTASGFGAITNTVSPPSTPSSPATVVDPSMVFVTDSLVGDELRLAFDFNGTGTPQARIEGGPATQTFSFAYRLALNGADVGFSGLQSQFESNVDSNSVSGGRIDVKNTISDSGGGNQLPLETFLETRSIGNRSLDVDAEAFTGTSQPLFVIASIDMDIDNVDGLIFHEVSIVEHQFAPVPIPAAAWLFGSAVGLFGVAARRKRGRG